MKKIVLAASLLLISATAHAGTYSVEGVTVHVQDGCMSSRCVAVYAPGYGYYDGATDRGGHTGKVHKAHKESSRFVSAATKSDANSAVPAPATEAARAQQGTTSPQAQPSDASPAK